VAPAGSSRTLEQQVQELLRRVAELEGERDRYRARIAELEQTVREQERELEEWRHGHRVRDKRYPDRKAKEASAAPRPPGRPPGHPGAGRPRPKEVDRQLELPLPPCKRCGSATRATGKVRVVPVEELVLKKEVIGFVQCQGACLCCGAVTWSQLPAALGPAPKLGVTAQSTAMMLRNDAGLTWGKVSKVMGVLGLPVTKGALQQMAVRLAARTRGSFAEIIECARVAAVLGMDETGLRHAGAKAWGWLARTPEFSLFAVELSRSHDVVVDLLGEEFEGVLVVDFYAAYEAYHHGLRQFCWPHLIREARKIAELDPCVQTQRFLERLVAAYHRGLELQAHFNVVGDHVMRTSLGRLIADRVLGVHADVARLQARMDKHFHGLLTFTGRPDVPSHNNGSEQDIRFLVIFRKLSFCTRSDDGRHTLAQLLSIGQTLRKQGRTWFDFLPAALAAYWSGKPPASVFSPRPAGCRGENATRTPAGKQRCASSPPWIPTPRPSITGPQRLTGLPN